MVWISPVRDKQPGATGQATPNEFVPLTAEERQRVVRVANAVRGLATLNLPIYPALIEDLFQVTPRDPWTFRGNWVINYTYMCATYVAVMVFTRDVRIYTYSIVALYDIIHIQVEVIHR
jgi:hypothetical protein